MNAAIKILPIVVIVLFFVLPCPAEMYRYKKDGVWYFTDCPPREMVEQSEKMATANGGAPAPSVEGTPLLENFAARNALEKASAAVVAVKGPLGYGSGFFISTDGYILTNKHVVRTTTAQVREEKQAFEEADNKIRRVENELNEEKEQLDSSASRLKSLKALSKNEKDPERKASYEDEYRYREKAYQEARANYEARRRQFEAELKLYRSQESDYKYSQLTANMSQSFEIILADNTNVYAYLVATCPDQDMALLKIDGYKTPALKTLKLGAYVPGWQLYAIGNPAKLKNSVTSGIFSGFEGGFIKTNAQIYPGNSGGPLVDGKGQVIGINTFKKLTYKYEGLGFAIPIDNALKAFSRYLGY